MSRVLCLLSIYILIDLCYGEWDQIAETRLEIDGLEDNVSHNGDNERMKLMGIDYYNGNVGAMRDNYEDSMEYRQLKSNNEDKPGKNIVILDSMDTRNYKAEIEAGNKADILGTNPHFYQPDAYPDFSRRFVLQYPYVEKKKKSVDKTEDKLTPKLASPELVLAVAEESALLDAAAPKDFKHHDVEPDRKDIMRTGDYWNAVWKEDVDPKVLRTKHAKKLETVRADIPPGSSLYNLVSKLKHLSPTVLYIINEKAS